MYYNVYLAMSIKVPCKSKGQHRFSFLFFTVCSRGTNNGLGWTSNVM